MCDRVLSASIPPRDSSPKTWPGMRGQTLFHTDSFLIIFSRCDAVCEPIWINHAKTVVCRVSCLTEVSEPVSCLPAWGKCMKALGRGKCQ